MSLLEVLFSLHTQLQGVEELLTAGNFHDAWAQSGVLPEEERHRARAEILYRAGDPAGAMEEAEAGLARAPDDLDLLFYASASSIWLEDGATAHSLALRLSRTLEDSASALDTSSRAAWDRTTRDHLVRAQAILEHEAARQGALARFRAVALSLLSAVLLVVGWAARSRSQGRSSKPVS